MPEPTALTTRYCPCGAEIPKTWPSGAPKRPAEYNNLTYCGSVCAGVFNQHSGGKPKVRFDGDLPPRPCANPDCQKMIPQVKRTGKPLSKAEYEARVFCSPRCRGRLQRGNADQREVPTARDETPAIFADLLPAIVADVDAFMAAKDGTADAAAAARGALRVAETVARHLGGRREDRWSETRERLLRAAKGERVR